MKNPPVIIHDYLTRKIENGNTESSDEENINLSPKPIYRNSLMSFNLTSPSNHRFREQNINLSKKKKSQMEKFDEI